MSWMKRPQGGTAPPPGPERQSYAAPQVQAFGNQQNMYPNYQAGTTGNVQPQQFWQMPSQQQGQYGQQFGQVYQQQDYPTNANQFYQQPAPNQFNQNYTSQGFNNTQTQSYQQNYYQTEGATQQNFQQNKPNTDSWEDNWDWGWEESAKQAQKANQNAGQPPAPPQQAAFNNANVIEESFASTDSWNWSMDEKKESKEPGSVPHNSESKEPFTLPTKSPASNNTKSETVNHIPPAQAEEVRSLNDKEVVRERLPNLALGKRFHLDNLTPQWSIESQMSQESSDGPHTHSEGTYRSDNQSRNSSKSSPGLNTDNSNFNYSQVGLEESFPQNNEWSRPTDEPPTDHVQSNSRRESHDELSGSLQELNLNNHEKPLTDTLPQSHHDDPKSSHDFGPVPQPPPAASPLSFPNPTASKVVAPVMATSMPPPPPVSSTSLPLSASSSATLQAVSSSSTIPPPNFPPPTSSQNPFKMNAGPFSHKTIAKVSTSATSTQAFSAPSATLASPAAVSKVSQHNRVSQGFEANLETTPDNSERPDQPQLSAFRPLPVSQQVPDNMEIAPQNDRNEYLQTAHLSSSDYGENTDFSRGPPPPGLRRMVVGQQESEYTQNLNISGDEPPPGLARMVPGQQTESVNAYNQAGDNYLDRHIDGQPTENSARPYRQADGQQTPDNYTQAPPARAAERRPIGLDRMVPGEPSNDEYTQYPTSGYAGTNEHRVVTGLDHDFSMPTDAGPPDVREQNVDGSDYTEQSSRNPPRNIIGARESSNDVSPDFNAPLDDQQREVIMEGENLQDLSIISSTELTYSREQVLDGADTTLADIATDRKTDLSDSIDHPTTSSRRQSLNRVNTSGEDSERDRAFKSSPRRDRDKHKSTRDRDSKRDRDRDRERERERDKDGRYSRGDRKYEPDRRAGREERERRERDGYPRERRDRDSPDARRHRRPRAPRYETEDTDYYSDRERDRRRHREGSYTSSKPPRPEDKERRYEERDRNKRYHTIERDRRYDDDRERRERRRGDRYRDRYERAYRDIDPSRKHGNLRAQRDDDARRVVTFSSDAKTNDSCTGPGELSAASRPESREAPATDEDSHEARRRARARRTAEPFYDEYGGGVAGGYADPYLVQRQQYQYYEHLRLTNPAAYMQVYKQLMAGHAPPVPPYFTPITELGGAQYEERREDRGSVHSGRSSAAGLKGNDTYGGYRLDGAGAGSLRDAPSLRTDLSDRDLNTDMSLNLHLEESTVRSERMTPFRYSTAHTKGSVASRDVVVVAAGYPADGAPPPVRVLSLAAALQQLPEAAELAAYPGPLLKGLTHKKSVIEYCSVRARNAAHEGARDVTGYVLLWELLALMLRQNGVVVGSDIAELLMKNTQEYPYTPAGPDPRDPRDSPDPAAPDTDDLNAEHEAQSPPAQSAAEQRAALDRLRELLIYGNRQEALEWAMRSGQWGQAWALGAAWGRRARAQVAARWLAALPAADPLHTLHAALAAVTPPAATCVSDERWGDWRAHAAIVLANPTPRPDHDRRTLLQLGDSLSGRGLVYCAQFCYVAAGEQLARHPLAPLAPVGGAPAAAPRLALLLADPRAPTLPQFAHNKALFATEIYEYAMSLNQDDFIIPEFQAYKLVLGVRLADVGQYGRALAYGEAAARAVPRAPAQYSRALLRALAALAERLQHHDPALHVAPPDDADSADASPRHVRHWLDDVRHAADAADTADAADAAPWTGPAQAQPQGVPDWSLQPAPPYSVPTEETPDYAAQYYAQQHEHLAQQQEQLAQQQHFDQQQQFEQQQHVELQQEPPAPAEEPQQYQYEEWARGPEPAPYADPYWQPDSYSYGEGEAPQISMPGSRRADVAAAAPAPDEEPDADSPKTSSNKKQEGKPKEEGGKEGNKASKGGGWLGGILTKLSLRPPNQMILPDDKNPTIVWDAESKRWRNLEGEGEGEQAAPPPPPRDLPPPLQSTSPPPPSAGAPPSAPVSNIFKMQKGRHIKKSYVDVLNPGGAAPAPAPAVLGPSVPLQPPPTYFVPAPLPQLNTEIRELEVVRPEAIEVMIPPSPTPSYSETPPPSPIPDVDPDESGVYEPAVVESERDPYEHTGI